MQLSLFKQIEVAGARLQVDLQISFLTIPRKHAKPLVYNRLLNALKLCSKDRRPVVTISTCLKNDKRHLSFSDNGIGIKAVDLPEVFVIFKRFNPEVTDRSVGINLVQWVINSNNGDIYLESQENGGTTFHV
jgi:light-regulated signal transduction histidine kinase (bacteriophytochrome)